MPTWAGLWLSREKRAFLQHPGEHIGLGQDSNRAGSGVQRQR